MVSREIREDLPWTDGRRRRPLFVSWTGPMASHLWIPHDHPHNEPSSPSYPLRHPLAPPTYRYASPRPLAGPSHRIVSAIHAIYIFAGDVFGIENGNG